MDHSPDRLLLTLPVMARLFDDSGAVVCLFDDDERLLYANARYYELVCHQPGTAPTWPEIVRDNHANGHGLIIDTDDVEAWIGAALKKRRVHPYRQFEVDGWDGRWLLMTETLVPDLGLLGIGVDITQTVHSSEELRRAYQNAQVRAETDELTEFGNRRALERLRKLLTSDGHHQVTALMIDIDRFKHYNDALGHSQGDRCLQQVAGLIRGSVRENESYPIRLGGDEFLVLMPDTDASQARQVAQRVIDSVRQSVIPHPATGSGYVSLSIGVASRKVIDSDSFSALLKDADDALYKAKRSGRNRFMGV